MNLSKTQMYCSAYVLMFANNNNCNDNYGYIL